jgi:hypothetical protein
VLAESGLAAQLRSQKISFVDLNRDEIFKVPTSASYTPSVPTLMRQFSRS